MEQIPLAGSLDDPKFTYSYFINEVETRVGPQRQKLGLVQSFPWFGVLENRRDAATAQAKAAEQRFKQSRLGLQFRIKKLYYEYVYLKTAYDLAKENIQLIGRFEQVAACVIER